MMIKYCFVVLYIILLSSCGGGGENKVPAPSPVQQDPGLAPLYISNTIFDMTINTLPAEELGNNFPSIGNKIIHEYSRNALFYLQSDQYPGWKYRGEYDYQRNKDEADITLTLASSNTIYNIHYQFTDTSTGTWQGTFNNGSSELSGTFTSKSTTPVSGYNFLGTVVNSQDVFSNITNITYQYNVYLPVGYFETDENYPVIYVTDAQWNNDELFAIAVETVKRDFIIVGITQGPDGQRAVDFLWPGSSKYLDFLATEMLPLVESQYRIDIRNRTLFGHSYGGLFIRHALINEVNTPLFKNFIASDGSYWYEDFIYQGLETDAYNANSLVNRKLYLSGASGSSGNGYVVSSFNDTIRSYGLEDFTIYHQSFDASHGEVVQPSIRDAFEILFP